MLTPPEVRAVYVVDDDGALTGVLTRKTLVAKVVAAGLDPRSDRDRRARRGAVLHDRCRHAARRGLPLPRGARRRARAGGRARPARRRALAQRAAAAPRRGRGARSRRRGMSAIDVAKARRRDARLRGRRPPEQRRRLADARRRAADGDRAPRARGADRRLRGGRARGRPGRGDLRLASPACSAARATRSRSSRTRPGPGTWRSTRSTSSRATGSSPAAPSTRRTTSRCCRWRSAPGAVVVVVGDDESGQVSLPALEAGARARRTARLARPRSLAGRADPAGGRRWGGCAGRRACRCCSTRASRSASCPTDVGELECDILSATGRKFLRGPRGTGFLYVRQELIEQLEPPFLDLHAAEWDDARHLLDPRRRAPVRELGDELRDEARPRRRGRLRARLGAAGDRRARAGRSRRRCGSSWRRSRASRCTTAGWRSAAIVTFTVAGEPAHEVAKRLGADGVNVSVTPVTYSRLDLGARGLDAVVRASVHYYNTEAELERLVELVGGDGGVSEAAPAAEPGAHGRRRSRRPACAGAPRASPRRGARDERAGRDRACNTSLVRGRRRDDRPRDGEPEPQGAQPAPRSAGDARPPRLAPGLRGLRRVAVRLHPVAAVTWDERGTAAARQLRGAGAALELEPTAPRRGPALAGRELEPTRIQMGTGGPHLERRAAAPGEPIERRRAHHLRPVMLAQQTCCYTDAAVVSARMARPRSGRSEPQAGRPVASS